MSSRASWPEAFVTASLVLARRYAVRERSSSFSLAASRSFCAWSNSACAVRVPFFAWMDSERASWRSTSAWLTASRYWPISPSMRAISSSTPASALATSPMDAEPPSSLDVSSPMIAEGSGSFATAGVVGATTDSVVVHATAAKADCMSPPPRLGRRERLNKVVATKRLLLPPISTHAQWTGLPAHTHLHLRMARVYCAVALRTPHHGKSTIKSAHLSYEWGHSLSERFLHGAPNEHFDPAHYPRVAAQLKRITAACFPTCPCVRQSRTRSE